VVLVVFGSFVRELHEQLVLCMNNFVEKLQKYQSMQAERINDRSAQLRKEMDNALQIVGDIDLLLQSPTSVGLGGRDMVNRCENFFRNCIDISQCDDDFSHLNFVPAGRLYVRSEHLGYLKLCDAVPEDVELKPMTTDEAVCNREFTVVIQTNHSKCIDATEHLDVQVTDSGRYPVPINIVNHNDGSYDVVFTPKKPGVHQLSVRLFGIAVGSSPMKITVREPTAAAAAAVSNMSGNRAPDVGSAASFDVPHTTASYFKSNISVDCSQNGSLDNSVKKNATSPSTENFNGGDHFRAPSARPTSSFGMPYTPPSRIKSGLSVDCCQADPLDSLSRKTTAPGSTAYFDDSEYFGAAISPHSVVKSSPGSASSGSKAVPMKQAKPEPPIPHAFDHGDCEDISGSFVRMKIDPPSPSASSRGCGQLSSTNDAQVGASSAIPIYASGAVLEFDELTYEPDEDFDSTGLN